jgi:hypothetical protein
MSTVRSEARVTTSRSARYLGQLCKHFAHRIPATFSDGQGRIEFPSGTCELEAAGDLLILRATAEDAPSLSQVEEVVGSHLERFAFRDKPEISWTRNAR